MQLSTMELFPTPESPVMIIFSDWNFQIGSAIIKFCIWKPLIRRFINVKNCIDFLRMVYLVVFPPESSYGGIMLWPCPILKKICLGWMIAASI